jgi:uncharacterized lipoprotein YddW (UPF0748 family)
LRKNNCLFTIIILLVYQSFVFSQVLRETRAVWLSTNYRLDWPPATYNQETQKKELIKIFDDLKAKNFNTIYFQVRFNGTVLYKSDIEPMSYYITGTTGDETAYDPLDFAIKEARLRGFEIHAWVNMLNTFNSSEDKVLTNPKHLYNTNPNWLLTWVEDNKKSYWLNPGIPEARKYLVDIVTEIASKYDVDGIQYDFLRYPGKAVDDKDTYEKYGNGLSIDDWRRQNINLLVRDIYISVKKIKPLIKIGAAPIGIYKSKPGAYGWEGLNDVYQDSRTWLKEGIIDYLAPQIYWDFKNNPRFDILADDWQANNYGRTIILGIGSYQKTVYPEMDKMISYARKIMSGGVAFFRYEHIKNFKTQLFDEPTYPPLMQWLEVSPPEAPVNLTYKILGNNNSSVLLEWQSPKDDLDQIKYYSIYKFENEKPDFSSHTLVDIVNSSDNSFTIPIDKPNSAKYYFAVKSINKGWLESTNYSNICEVIIPTLYNFAKFINGSDKIMLLTSNYYTVLFINSATNDNIAITGKALTNEEKLLYKGNVKSGKNYIQLSSIKQFSALKLTFTNSTKTMELKLN